MTANMVLVLVFDAGAWIGARRPLFSRLWALRAPIALHAEPDRAPHPISPNRSRPLKTQVGLRRLAGDAYGGRHPNCQGNGPFGYYDQSCAASAAKQFNLPLSVDLPI